MKQMHSKRQQNPFLGSQNQEENQGKGRVKKEVEFQLITIPITNIYIRILYAQADDICVYR